MLWLQSRVKHPPKAMSTQPVPRIRAAWVSVTLHLRLPGSGQGTVCKTSAVSQLQLTFLGFFSQDLNSPGRYLLTSKQSHSGREARGNGTAPSALFPINFSPVAFTEARIMTMVIIRIFLCMAASCGVNPPSMLSSSLPEDQRVSSV